ncbi:uncharacterized protein [Primulina eburnea]|uniref:uncharacterized protein n=1 Tax=Primulina eburnea TaxID=1245227 RepID=UPI003C6BE5A9
MGHLKKNCPQLRGGAGSGSGSQTTVQQRMQGQAMGSSNLRPRAQGQVFALNQDQAADETGRVIAEMEDFDCILGIDLLTTYRATVDCYQKLVQFRTTESSSWFFYGEGARPPMPVVSALKACRALESGGEGYLIYAIDSSTSSVGTDDIPVVCEFPDVFPDEIPGFPPIREVEFGIELMPGTTPISRAPYRLAPSEMRELKQQLQDLLDKGYIRPSVSPWGAPVLFVKKKDGSMRLCIDYRQLNRPDLNMRQRRWMELLKDFDCEIQYQPSRMNLVADALSRKVQNSMLTSLTISKVHEHLGTSGWTYQISGNYFIVSSIQVEPQILSRIKAAQKTDPHIHRLKELSRTGQTEKFSVASDGSLRFNGRLLVPNLIDLKEAILKEAHCSRHSIHPGIRKMYHTLRAHYWWEGMKKDISHFVAKCLTCQQVKAERMRPGGMLHSLEVPQWNWEHIAMDFVTHLPRSNRGCDAIWCRSPICWEDVGERQLSKPEFIQEMKDKVELIRKRMKAAQDRQASYANQRRRPLEFQVGDYVFLKVSPFRGTMRFGHKGKLAPRYIGLYMIIERIDTLAYRLDLPQSLSLIHNVFHVSMLRKYEPDPSHILNVEDVELDSSLSYVEHPVQNLDRKERQLRSKTIPLVLVQWSRHGREEST